jgi:predicted membrane metal-binding protein
MDNLPTLAQVGSVAAGALLGPVVAFLVALVVAILFRCVAGAGEPPPLVLVVAGIISRFLRQKLWPRPEVAAQSGREPPPDKPAAAAAPPM